MMTLVNLILAGLWVYLAYTYADPTYLIATGISLFGAFLCAVNEF